jgi:hypothetical protein
MEGVEGPACAGPSRLEGEACLALEPSIRLEVREQQVVVRGFEDPTTPFVVRPKSALCTAAGEAVELECR